MGKEKAMEALKELKICFREVSRIAWDNCPDADRDCMRQFENDMETAERDFKKAYEDLEAALMKQQ